MTSTEIEARVMLCYDVARAHGSLPTLTDLLRMLPEPASEAELAGAFESIPSLSARFEISGGYLMERNRDTEGASPLEETIRGRLLAGFNMRFALDFVPLLHTSPFEMVSVSGSTSYRSATRSRDLDFFCVVPSGQLWLSLTQGLILARVFGLLHRRGPQICFSCLMDEDYAESVFSTPQDPLFARDALETKVIKGDATYLHLMRRASWLSLFFPAGYSKLVGCGGSTKGKPKPSTFKRSLNRFLFLTVGGFIRAKSRILNARLARLGLAESTFTVRLADDHLVYESQRYVQLRRMYSAAFSKPEIVPR